MGELLSTKGREARKENAAVHSDYCKARPFVSGANQTKIMPMR